VSKDCIFCRIARKEEPASFVYEDESVVAFLDAIPISEGHALVVPRRHYENIFAVPEEEIAYLFKIVKRVALAVYKSEQAEGISIIQNNGIAAHQVVFHFHVHVIPRHERADSHAPRAFVESSELDKVAARIRKYI
jgi:diadenosine tetraphosphate (Ap4A) HIT family hydrolase